MHQNIFNFIDGSYNTFKELLPDILQARQTIDKDFINEYIHLLTNINFDFENLYAHDMEQPNYETLQGDYFKLVSCTLKFKNYCIMIDCINIDNFFNLVDDIKINYYYYLDNNYFEEEY